MFKKGNIPHNKGITKFPDAQALVLAKRQYGREWRRKHLQADKEHQRRYQAANIEKHNQLYYEQASANPWDKVCSMCCRSLPISLFCKSRMEADGFNYLCKECSNEASRKEYASCRRKIIYHYSAGRMNCHCCGEDNYEFLSIDHINGGGSKHRTKVGLKTGDFYRWLIKNNYPTGYRVLCYNCNCSLGFYGYCPHQRRR